MKSFYPAILLLLFLFTSTSAGASCRDEYRCDIDEICWNGQCITKGIRDRYAEPRRSLQYGYNVARNNKRCVFHRDCRGVGFGYVCDKATCRLITSG